MIELCFSLPHAREILVRFQGTNEHQSKQMTERQLAPKHNEERSLQH